MLIGANDSYKARDGDKLMLISCMLHICRNSACVFLPRAAPQDYIGISTHLLLTPSETRKCINITLLDDSIVEEREKFALELASSEVGILLNPNKTTITIEDTDRKSLHNIEMQLTNQIMGQLTVVDTVYSGEISLNVRPQNWLYVSVLDKLFWVKFENLNKNRSKINNKVILNPEAHILWNICV